VMHRAASILTAVQILPVAFERHGGLKIFLFRAQKLHFRQHGSSTTNSRFLHDLDNGDKVDLHVIEIILANLPQLECTQMIFRATGSSSSGCCLVTKACLILM